MKQSKKVILFIVEGITDETTLGLVLSKIIEANQVVRFKVIGGDLTTEYGTTVTNCITKLVGKIKEFLSQDFYKKSDISQVIHLVDLDGVYISDSYVVEDKNQLPQGDHTFYTKDNIVTDNAEQICKRNHQKAQILDKLMNTTQIYAGIPYSVYFFSCNLEHVLYDCQNMPDKEKYQYAKKTEDQYAAEPFALVDFMNDSKLIVSGDYEDTWDYIKHSLNSLKRSSNFHLLLNQFVCK